MAMNPKVSVIVPVWLHGEQHGSYGRHETFFFALMSLRHLRLNSRPDTEIVLVDNGCSLIDAEIEAEMDTWAGSDYSKLWRDGYPHLEEMWALGDKVVRNEKNLGYAPAMNQGFEASKGKLVVFGNDDLLVYPGWEDALEQCLENKDLLPPCGIAMPALMKETRNFCAALTMLPDLTLNAGKFGQGAAFGAFWMAKRETLDRLREDNDGKVFDEGYVMGMKEDKDLFRRLRAMGMETYRTHAARVFHVGNATVGKMKNRRQFIDANTARFEKKWGGR